METRSLDEVSYAFNNFSRLLLKNGEHTVE